MGKEKLLQVKKFKNYLLSVNFSLSTSEIEVLNSVTDKNPIFMLPGVLGIFGAMRAFVEINFPLIALNVTSEVNRNHSTIKLAAQYYMDLLRRLYPDIKRYNLVGMDYGAWWP